MSLDRFTNKEDILSIDGPARGIVWNKDDVESLGLELKTVTPEGTIEVEVHVYTRDGDYINSVITPNFTVRGTKVYVNYGTTLGSLGIRRGEFEVVTNVHEAIIGRANNRLLQVKQISPDRREILATIVPPVDENIPDYETIIPDYLQEYSKVYDADLAINFGKNNICKIINHKAWDSDNELVLRLYNTVPDDVLLNDTFHIVEELADPYIDNVELVFELPEEQLTYIKGPNFEIDEGYATITETEFKSWNDLLDANLSTSQQILDRMFSGSLSGVPLGIDYSAFDNFVFYSSAYERLANFKYKLELIEYYNKRIVLLDNALGSDSGSLTNNVTITQQRIDNLLGSFDGFERWLYYEPTASLTTHGVSGSYLGADGYVITPWPKYLSNGAYVVYSTTSSIANNWFTASAANAVLYDDLNNNALTKTIPEHIRIDQNNSQYELFVNMIGHHFDILYSYINALTRVYRPEEQPKLGVGKDTLYDIAKSMGWTLANGNQATALWKYKLGVDTDGRYQSTGSLFSKANEEITTEVWRRIVNNLPYLLKTKGTERSVRALMSCYGVPRTLLSVREYGGPVLSGEAPNLIEDRYSYMLVVNNDANPALLNGVTGISFASPTGGITRELRFRAVSGSYADMELFSGDGPTVELEYFSSGLYSGSDQYGRAVLNGTINTPWAPIFDGDIWNIRWWRTSGGTGFIQVQKASDYIRGHIAWSVSASGAVSAFGTSTGTIASGFTGYIQEFRQWSEILDQATFDDHTLNPTSYASSTYTSSYTTLQVHYTLGSDGNAYDHDASSIVSSSHPNRSYTSRNGNTTSALTPTDPQLGNYIGVEEVYYIQGVSLGGNLPRSQKIRFEDNTLVGRLSPVNSVERSPSDLVSIDSNKLGLFYSQADQVNKDIFNQFGDAELDAFIGDPDDEFESGYGDLTYASNQYWQKYTDRNDVNAYLRIFSQFDFSLFNQIRQLLPARANAAMGILIEPHALERAKVLLTRRPQVENPQYNAEIFQPELPVTAEYALYSGSVAGLDNIISAESVYHSGSSNGYEETGNTWFARIAGVINTGSMDYCTIEIPPSDERPAYTASIIDVISYSNNNAEYFDWYAFGGPVPGTTSSPSLTPLDPRINDLTVNRAIAFQTPAAGYWTYFEGSQDQTDTVCLIFSNPSYDIDVDIDYRLLNTISTSGGDFGITSATFALRIGIGVLDNDGRLEYVGNGTTRTVSYSTGTNSVTTGSIQNVRIPYTGKRTAVTLQYKCLTTAGTSPGCLVYDGGGGGPLGDSTFILKIRNVCHSSEMPVIDQPRPSTIYNKIVYSYSGSGDLSLSLRDRNAQHAYSQSLGLYYKREDVPAAYFDDALAQYENSRYEGCRISSPEINLPTTTESATAIAGTPVIEVYETNPNQLIFTQAPESRTGTNNTEPGNLIVR
jgi:hypothetical protein